MLTQKELEAIKNFYYIMEIILGRKDRYSIHLINEFDNSLKIIIFNNNKNEMVLNQTIKSSDITKAELINELRNIFILYGAKLSVLNNNEGEILSYYKQKLYAKNLEMNIDINFNNDLELISAINAHNCINNPKDNKTDYNKILKRVSR